MCRAVILVPNLTCNKYHTLIQCNTTQWLIVTTGLSPWHYGHAIIVTAVWGSIRLANHVLNDQPTTLRAPLVM